MANDIPKTQLYNTLNNYGYSDESIAEVKKYLRPFTIRNGVLDDRINDRFPDRIKTDSERRAFVNKWKHFTVENNELVYHYRGIRLQVVPENERNDVMKAMFLDMTTGVGAGQHQFYYQIIHKYLNITREDCSEFLKREKVFQMTRPIRHIVNKPILVVRPNELWAIDLVDMQRYQKTNIGFRYILTCVDYFSGYVWARALKKKTAVDVRDAMNDIASNEAKIFPERIMSDNGGEFMGALKVWCGLHNIKQTKTLSYSPESNGKCENMNNQIRKMIREIMLRTVEPIWYSYLPTICKNKNSQRNSTTKARAVDIWRPNHAIPADNEVANNIRAKAKQQIKKNATMELRVGQYVRVKMGALFSEVRNMIKSKEREKKYVVVKYSPDIYQISAIYQDEATRINVEQGLQKKVYVIKYITGNNAGQTVLTQYKRNKPNAVREAKRFFASDFLPIREKDAQLEKHEENPITENEAHMLNQLENKIDYAPPPKQPKIPRVKTVRQPKPPVNNEEPILAQPLNPQGSRTSGRVRDRVVLNSDGSRKQSAIIGGNLIYF